MNYTVDIEINLPRARVIELFDDPENMKHWQEGFISMEHVSGTLGEIGAKSRLNYKMGKREIEMIETIIARDLPGTFSATYEADGVWNEIHNYFSEVGEGKTLWKSDVEFKFTTLMMKVFGFLMPGAFKKQSLKYMQDFKKFAEET